IVFAAEIGSISNTRETITAKQERYAAFVRPQELLETDPIDEERGERLTPGHLQLYRLTDQGYEEVERQPSGRFRSETLGLEIGVDEEHNLRLYTLDGERVLTYKEAERARLTAEAHARNAAYERLLAEQRVEQVTRERAAAEQRVEQVTRERAAAEQRVEQ